MLHPAATHTAATSVAATASCGELIVVAFRDMNASSRVEALRESALAGNYTLIDQPWEPRRGILQRIITLRKLVEEHAQRCGGRSVLLHTDAYDAFFARHSSDLLQAFRSSGVGALVAAEADFAWQPTEDKSHWDTLGANRTYRYLNSGGLIGYPSALIPLLQSAERVCGSSGHLFKMCQKWQTKGADQTALGHALRLSGHHASLDYENRVFLVPRVGWRTTPEVAAAGVLRHARFAGSCVVHVPWLTVPKRRRVFQLVYSQVRNATMGTR